MESVEGLLNPVLTATGAFDETERKIRENFQNPPCFSCGELQVIHAEMAAITSCFRDVRDFDAYVTLFPCSNCAKLLIEKGVNTIYYLSDKYKDLPDTIASKKIARWMWC